MLRARMVVSMEKLFGERERARAEYFPRHYFVLVPLGDGQMSGLSSGDQWNGVLNALKSEIRELRDRLQEQSDRQEQGRVSQERGITSLKRDICDRQDRALGKMEGTIDQRVGKMEGTIGEVMERVERVEARLGAMEETLLAIFREVKR
jgi:DNA anti-recombination protein RmuC